MADKDVVAQAYATAKKAGASSTVTLALFEAGVVESSFRNLDHGPDDSVGYLQQRPSQGWQSPMDVATATQSFLTKAIAYEKAHPGASAGQIAQGVQRSAFPDRYNAAEQQALALLKGTDPAVGSVAAAQSALSIPGLPDIPGLDAVEGQISTGIMLLLERIGKAADAFTSKAKFAEQIATSVTKAFLPSNLLRAAAGLLGTVFLLFSLWLLGRELRA